MEHFVWRYQAVYQERNGVPTVGVHEVAVDETTGDILYLLTEDPVDVQGESVEALVHMLYHIQRDTKEYGVITYAQLQAAIERANSKFEEIFTATDVFSDELISDEEWAELFNSNGDVPDLLDEQFDEEGKVLDLVDFMKRNK